MARHRRKQVVFVLSIRSEAPSMRRSARVSMTRFEASDPANSAGTPRTMRLVGPPVNFEAKRQQSIAEYCGTKHSGMIGKVHVLPAVEYQAWLGGASTGESLAQKGEKLFSQLACVTCHSGTSQGRGPALNGIWGHPVQLANGITKGGNTTVVRHVARVYGRGMFAQRHPIRGEYVR